MVAASRILIITHSQQFVNRQVAQTFAPILSQNSCNLHKTHLFLCKMHKNVNNFYTKLPKSVGRAGIFFVQPAQKFSTMWITFVQNVEFPATKIFSVLHKNALMVLCNLTIPFNNVYKKATETLCILPIDFCCQSGIIIFVRQRGEPNRFVKLHKKS